MKQKTKFLAKCRLWHPKYCWLLGLFIIAGSLMGWQYYQDSQKGKISLLSNLGHTATATTESVKQSAASSSAPAAQKSGSLPVLKGKVKPKMQINLSFKTSGIVSQMNVSAGDRVSRGASLGELNPQDAQNNLSQAQANVDLAQAQYDKAVNGNSQTDITIAQANVAAAQTTFNNGKKNYSVVVQQQQVIISNDLETLLNSSLVGIPAASNGYVGTLTISGTYTATTTGAYTITFGATMSGGGYYYSGLEAGSGTLFLGVPLPLGTSGLYFTVPKTATINAYDSWAVSVPNPQGATYLKNLNAYQNDLQAQTKAVATAQATVDSAKAALEQANAQLVQKARGTRPEDVAVAKARLNLAKAKLQAAQNNVYATKLAAPIDGVVTSVNAAIGEQVASNKNVFTIVDDESFYAETEVSEKTVNQIHAGDQADVVIIGLNANKHYKGTVIFIAPAAGNGKSEGKYAVYISLPNIEGVKFGMSVNIKILRKKTKSSEDF